MSADNWGQCPKCIMLVEKANKQALEKANEGYGKLPKEKYLELLKESEKPIPVDNTLREDYEFYMPDDGEFEANYSCHCDKCGFKYDFNYKDKLDIK